MNDAGRKDSPDIEEALELSVEAGVRSRASMPEVAEEIEDFLLMVLALLDPPPGVSTETTFIPIELPVDAGMKIDVIFFLVRIVRGG